jgi:protein-tyrosine phosphatase
MTSSPPARHIPLQGTTNFRDLGGYTGHEGRTVRWRTLFRSDHLASLTPQDLQQLGDLGLQRAVDFRGAMERDAHGYQWPQWDQHVLSVEPTLVQKAMLLMQQGRTMQAQDAVVLMQETYCSFVVEHAQQFANLFALLLNADTPLVFHCTAGKDRTGWAAALILHALGVAPEAIAQDYLLTNALYQRPAALAAKAAHKVDPQILEVLWKVQLPFLDSAYAMVHTEFGSLETYLREVMGLDAAALAHLRAQYLSASN